MSRFVAELTSGEVEELLRAAPLVVLLPVGSVEPHGPHLPLETDTLISTATCRRAVELLSARGVSAVIAPAIPYGVTDFAAGFAGAVSISGAVLTSFVGAVVDAWLAAGARHVSLVNNHLEPAQARAIRAVLDGRTPGSVSVACPLTRKWARTLSAEFKSGACHAGRYETSLVLAERAAAVRIELMSGLPAVPTSLSEGILAGKTSFKAMGLDRAYAGAPAEASAGEGEQQLALLAEMVVGEVQGGLALLSAAPDAAR